MDERSRHLESQLDTDMQQNELCLLSGETASLYVDDVNTASLTNGRVWFFLCWLHSRVEMSWTKLVGIR